MNSRILQAATLLASCGVSTGYVIAPPGNTNLAFTRQPTPLRMSSYSMDGSEYSSRDSDFLDDDDMGMSGFGGNKYSEDEFQDDEDENSGSPTTELKPVPMSKNSGNRFVALLWDRELDTKGRDPLQMHEDRNEVNEDHVMFCRKKNLYSEEFNTDSMVDILWSRPILASDLKRLIGHAICMESTKLEYVRQLMAEEPVIKMLTGGDLSNIPLYRWRHIRDYSMRMDDGRFGCPCMLVAMDHDPEEIGNLRTETNAQQLEHLIRSERIIAAGPLHFPTELKDDPASSLPLGDLIFFNAKNREEAIDFAESLPMAQEGVYSNMRVHFYNTLDITGKFVSEDPLRDSPCEQMKEAMEVWGYPVEDEQTPWLNW